MTTPVTLDSTRLYEMSNLYFWEGNMGQNLYNLARSLGTYSVEEHGAEYGGPGSLLLASAEALEE